MQIRRLLIIPLTLFATVLLGACSFGILSNGMKPVAQNGWTAGPDSVNDDLGAVIYTAGDVRVMVAPPLWHQYSFVGPGIPFVPIYSGDKAPYLHASFYITSGNIQEILDLEGLKLRCTREGQRLEEDIGYEIKRGAPDAISVVPSVDLSQMKSCTIHFDNVFKSNAVHVPDLTFNAGMIGRYVPMPS